MSKLNKTNEDYWQEELNKALINEGITEKQFFKFMKGKIRKFPIRAEEFVWGVFPITNKEGILVDIRMVVPTIYDEKSLCINIHEYTHAYEVYSSLGEVYVWNIEESEKKAREAEKRYLKNKNKIQ